jgi:transcriptional regulator with PAS, ATPase and Fis domain
MDTADSVLPESPTEETINVWDDDNRSTSMFEEIVGSSDAIRRVTEQVMRVAPSDATVLVTGESGTGKELIARAIHKRSRRSQSVFKSMNCAVTPPSLMAAELLRLREGRVHRRQSAAFRAFRSREPRNNISR